MVLRGTIQANEGMTYVIMYSILSAIRWSDLLVMVYSRTPAMSAFNCTTLLSDPLNVNIHVVQLKAVIACVLE